MAGGGEEAMDIGQVEVEVSAGDPAAAPAEPAGVWAAAAGDVEGLQADGAGHLFAGTYRALSSRSPCWPPRRCKFLVPFPALTGVHRESSPVFFPERADPARLTTPSRG